MSSQLPNLDQQQEPFEQFLEEAYVKTHDVFDVFVPEEPINEFLFSDSDFNHR